MKERIAPVISNNAQLLLTKGDLSEEQRDEVQQILIYMRKMSDLITNILKMNRLEKQQIQPEKEIYDACEQVCDCILQFEEKWEEKEVELEVNLDERVYIEADPSLLELVWNNLLSNSVKFTGLGGNITITEILISGSKLTPGVNQRYDNARLIARRSINKYLEAYI